MSEVTFTPIGVIRTPFLRRDGTPKQAVHSGGARATLELLPEYAAGLRDLEEFERVWVVFHLDRAEPWQPLVTPYLDGEERGLFATRSPDRPNPIGISAVKLLSIEGSRVVVEGIDVLDGTPVLDVKPYVPDCDAFPSSRTGWLEVANAGRRTDEPPAERAGPDGEGVCVRCGETVERAPGALMAHRRVCPARMR